MARSIGKKLTVTTIVGDVFTEWMDITNYNGGSFQFVGGATTTGSITIQRANDNLGTNAFDTAVTSALSGGKGFVDSGLQFAGFIRLKITIATNPGAATVIQVGKES